MSIDIEDLAHLKTPQDWENYLRNEAPLLLDKPDGYKGRIKIYLKAMCPPFRKDMAPFVLSRLWGRRCEPSLQEDIFEVMDELAQIERAEQERREQVTREKAALWQQESIARDARLRAKEKARRAEVERKKKSAELTRQLAVELGVSTRQALNYRKEGTTKIEIARVIAKVCGGRPRDYLRHRRPRSHKHDVAARILAIEFEGCTFEDFVNSDAATSPVYGDRALVLNLKSTEDSGKGLGAIQTLDDLYAHLHWTETKDPKQFVRIPYIWADYKFWRLDRVVTIAQFQINDGIVFHRTD